MSGNDPADSYRRVYEEHYSKVYAYCVRRVEPAYVADAVAEVFAVAWRRFDDVPLGDRTLPWLYGVAYRVVSHHRRGQGRRRRLGKRLAGLPARLVDQPDSQLVQHQDYALALAAIKRLKPIDQEVLRLAVWEELGHAEIASSLEMTVAATRQRFHRAKRALLKEFERLGGVVDQSPVAREGGEQ